jgi:hypothetical protein
VWSPSSAEAEQLGQPIAVEVGRLQIAHVAAGPHHLAGADDTNRVEWNTPTASGWPECS